MNRLIDSIVVLLPDLKKWDRARYLKELKEFFQILLKQIYNQIPGISAIAGLIAGGWIASTFTTSPFKATLASWGIIKGGRHVVSGLTYQLLSIVIPLLAAGLTAYFVQKLLKTFRTRRMEKNMAIVEESSLGIKEALRERLAILEKAKEMGILSQGEYFTKKANLYQTWSRILPEQFKELILNKLS